MAGQVSIIRGNALELPLADNSVDLIVTSPPYFGLRSYQDGGEHYDGQIGAEATPSEFVDALIAATAEMVRVVKPSGSIWVNLGDKFAGSDPGRRDKESMLALDRRMGRAGAAALDRAGVNRTDRPTYGAARPKSLIGIPWRYAIRCIDELGLILRAEVIWSKPNGLPESVTDRVRRSHEHWFHFTLEPRYYSAVDEVREEHAPASLARYQSGFGQTKHSAELDKRYKAEDVAPNPLGKLPGSVWTSERNALGESTIGLVLRATSEGQLTPEEGERILWAGRTNSGARWTSPATAGNGSGSWTDRDTDATGARERATAEHTGSPTNSSRGRSLGDSTSTTCAGTRGASTLITSSPSPSPRTTPDDRAGTDAQQDTTTTSGTPTFDATASESAAPASATVSESAGGSDSPPSVWVVPTEPLHVPDHLGIDHFAAFPTEWPRRIITGWSPRGVCVECGAGRRPVVERQRPEPKRDVGMYRPNDNGQDGRHGLSGQEVTAFKLANPDRITGEACDCAEPTAPTTPGVVLDPFGGTGTTALVASVLGRDAISVDMSADYCRLAEWRTSDPKQRAKAGRVPHDEQRAPLAGQEPLL